MAGIWQQITNFNLANVHAKNCFYKLVETLKAEEHCSTHKVQELGDVHTYFQQNTCVGKRIHHTCFVSDVREATINIAYGSIAMAAC